MKSMVLFFALSAAGLLTAASREAYDKACKSCHGPEGKGNPAIAKMMKVALRPLGSKEVQAKSDADLKKTIAEGSGKMKAITSLSPQQVNEVIAFLRTLQE